MQNIIVLGTGGNAIDIAEAAEAEREGTVRGFLDDNEGLWGKKIGKWPILGRLGESGTYPDCHFVNGIGSPHNFRNKPEIIARTGLSASRFANIIHPQAWVSPSAQLGRGVAILAGARICAHAKLGDHVIVLPNAVVSHHDTIGDYSCIASGACISGNVTVGSCVYIGSNSSIRGMVAVGDEALIGMGAVVVKDVAEGETVVGNPARP